MYKRVKTDESAILDNGVTFYPVATLADESGGRCQISIDDDCYVLSLKREEGYIWTNHIFPEAFNVLETLPGPTDVPQDESKEMKYSLISAPKPFKLIIKAVKRLGWDIALTGKDEDLVNGLIIGTEEYIDKILDK